MLKFYFQMESGSRFNFAAIAKQYTLINRLASAGRDNSWRKKAARILAIELSTIQSPFILDFGCGNGEMSQAILRELAEAQVVSYDICPEMLAIFSKKRKTKKKTALFELIAGLSGQFPPFKTEKFNAVICAFSIRNFSNLQSGLKQIAELLKKDGLLLILEFFPPQTTTQKIALFFAERLLFPFFCFLFRIPQNSYQYLSSSIRGFHSAQKLLNLLETIGFSAEIRQKMLTGIVKIIVARRRTE